MSFNTLDGGLKCPLCQSEILSGVGFRFGRIANLRYKIGDSLCWDGEDCRPGKRPQASLIKTVGYFNCDNVFCATWQDCYPAIQIATITIRDNVIERVEPYAGPTLTTDFPILEPRELVHL
jgi:hypothetical protein